MDPAVLDVHEMIAVVMESSACIQNLSNVRDVGRHLSPNRDSGLGVDPAADLSQHRTVLSHGHSHLSLRHPMWTRKVDFKGVLQKQSFKGTYFFGCQIIQMHIRNLHIIQGAKLRAKLQLTTPVSSTRSMISCQASRLYSSIIDAMRIRSGYSSFSCFISASMVSKGRSLMSSMFSHPITSALLPEAADAFNLA
jgi:hypothetical protein